MRVPGGVFARPARPVPGRRRGGVGQEEAQAGRLRPQREPRRHRERRRRAGRGPRRAHRVRARRAPTPRRTGSVMLAAALVAALPYFHGDSTMAGLTQAEMVTHAIEGWHEFYLLAGTAAVTLVGLLFVALSFHLDALLHEQRAHLLHAARLAFMNFLFVLMLSLFFLIPLNTPQLLGVSIFVLSVGTL